MRLRFVTKGGTVVEIELLADTGNPFGVVISQAAMANLILRTAPDVSTNFGDLQDGWVRVHMPELGVDADIVGYGSDVVVKSTQTSCSSFEGLAGLPLMRMLEYGGDVDWFWLRKTAGQP